MKNLLLILFFSKIVLLTPAPIQLTDTWLELSPDKPIEAITSGASIYIDITSSIPSPN